MNLALCARWGVTLLGFFIAARLSADTVIFYPVADTTLFETDPNNNFGADSTLVAGTTAGSRGLALRSRALIKFDPGSSIPTNAVISSASLTVKVDANPTPRADSVFDVRRVLRSWNEGKKSGQRGAAATSGETTWRARFFGTTNLWAVPGGATNVDFSATIGASTMVRGVGVYTFASTSNLVADVQSWLQDTNSNFGWIMMTESEGTPRTARRFYARERKNTNDIPRLVVEFAVPTVTTPPQISSRRRSGDIFELSFSAGSNRSYAVEFADALPARAWQTLTNILASSTAQRITISDVITNAPQRFYRIRTQ